MVVFSYCVKEKDTGLLFLLKIFTVVSPGGILDDSPGKQHETFLNIFLVLLHREFKQIFSVRH